MADPTIPRARSDYSAIVDRPPMSLINLRDFKLRAGDAPDALEAYEESPAIARKLAAADEGNVQWQHELSVSLNRLGIQEAAF
jgi:hypothetical protein